MATNTQTRISKKGFSYGPYLPHVVAGVDGPGVKMLMHPLAWARQQFSFITTVESDDDPNTLYVVARLFLPGPNHTYWTCGCAGFHFQHFANPESHGCKHIQASRELRRFVELILYSEDGPSFTPWVTVPPLSQQVSVQSSSRVTSGVNAGRDVLDGQQPTVRRDAA